MTNKMCDHYTKAEREAALYWATKTAVAAFIEDSTPPHRTKAFSAARSIP